MIIFNPDIATIVKATVISYGYAVIVATDSKGNVVKDAAIL